MLKKYDSDRIDQYNPLRTTAYLAFAGLMLMYTVACHNLKSDENIPLNLGQTQSISSVQPDTHNKDMHLDSLIEHDENCPESKGLNGSTIKQSDDGRRYQHPEKENKVVDYIGRGLLEAGNIVLRSLF